MQIMVRRKYLYFYSKFIFFERNQNYKKNEQENENLSSLTCPHSRNKLWENIFYRKNYLPNRFKFLESFLSFNGETSPIC